MDKDNIVDWYHIFDLYTQKKMSRDQIIRAATEEKHRLIHENDMMMEEFLLFALIDIIVGFYDYEWRFSTALDEFQKKLNKCCQWTHSMVIRLQLYDSPILNDLLYGYKQLKKEEIEDCRFIVQKYSSNFDSPTRISDYFIRSIIYLMMGLIGENEFDTWNISDNSIIMQKIEELFDSCLEKKCILITVEVKNGKANFLFF